MMSSGGNPSTTSNAGGTAANPPSNPFLDSYRAWSERTPFITRITTILVLVVYILSFFFDLDNYLTNIPLRSVNYFEFYRILLSPLVGNSIIFLIIMLLSFPAIGTKMENSMGSGAFLFLMLTIDIAINLSFLSLCYILYFSGVSDALLWPCADFWTILFALISIDCFLDPETTRRLLCIPYDIPSKYMPLALYLFMVVLSAQLFISYALSIAFGYIFVKGYLDTLKPSSYLIERLEQEGGIFRYGSRQPGWVLAATLGHDPWIALNSSSSTVRDSHPATSGAGAGPTGPTGFSMFGGRGSGYQPVPTNNMDDDSAHNPIQQFPGSGHKLATANTATPSSGFFNTAAPAAPSAPPSREEIAARRLAAMNAQQTGGTTVTSV